MKIYNKPKEKINFVVTQEALLKKYLNFAFTNLSKR